MKILQINKFFYIRGGSERYMFELSELLKKNGHTVSHFSMADSQNWPSKYKRYFADKVDVNNFGISGIMKTFYNFDAVRKLKRLIEKEKPDIAHLHNISHHLSPAIIKVLKGNGIKVVMTLHDYKIVCPNRMLFTKNKVCQKCQGKYFYHCFANKCIQDSYLKSIIGMLEAYWQKLANYYDQVDLFIAPSQFLKDIFVRSGIPENKIMVLNNFIADEFYKNIGQKELRDKDYLLYFGRLSAEKGIPVLLEAVANTGYDLKIVGAGPEYENVKRQIKKLKLTKRVKLTGPKYGDKLWSELLNAKAIIMPSLWPENMPYSLLESMALGKIVIAAETGGMPEIITDGRNGFLFKTGDYKNLAEKINNLDKFILEKISWEATLTIKRLNSNNHYKNIIGFYQSLIK